jgi:hypothetical protein
MAEIEQLKGGREAILRQGKTVRRPAGPWSPSVHRLLAHLHAHGFHAAPHPIGFDGAGNELVSYLEGRVSNDLQDQDAGSEEALITAAQLLRAYHDAVQGFAIDDAIWMLPARKPAEIVCHGDFAPYNVVLDGRKAVGLIDFDTAHPGPVLWDIVYALYRWAPFSDPEHDGIVFSFEEQIARGRLFCDAYGLDTGKRSSVPAMMIERLETMVRFMTSRAEAGDQVFQGHIAEGHHQIYLHDVRYIQSHAERIAAGL